MLPKKYFLPVLLLAIGIALIFLDKLLFNSEYSAISVMGHMATSTGIMYLLIMLIFPGRSPDYLFLQHIGAFTVGLCVINILLMLLNLWLTAMVLPSLVVITSALLFAGIGLMILPPYKATDEELLQLIARKSNLIEYTIKASPLVRKIGWLACGLLGGWAGYLVVQQFVGN